MQGVLRILSFLYLEKETTASSTTLTRSPLSAGSVCSRAWRGPNTCSDRARLVNGSLMSSANVETVTTNNTLLGEGPHWDDTENVLYYVDILGKEIFKFDPAKKQQTSVRVDDTASFIIPVKGQNDQFVISAGRHVSLLTWDGASEAPGAVEAIATVEEQDEEKRGGQLNDGKADPAGRLWAGTIRFDPPFKVREKFSSLYSMSRERIIKKHVSDITISNGLAWNKDQKTMFYADSHTYKIDAFDFNCHSGTIENRRTAFDFKANGVPGMPDGMTIDTEDKLWVACADGRQVIQVDPVSGELLQSVSFPCPLITSVVFGGKNLDELYVTSGAITVPQEEKSNFPSAGCVFRVTGIGAKGFPMNRVVL